MMKSIWKKGIVFLLIVSLIASRSGCTSCTNKAAEEIPEESSEGSQAEEAEAEQYTILSLEGKLQAEDAEGNTRTLKAVDSISSQETLITGKGSTVKIALDADTTLYLDENTRTQITSADHHTDVTLEVGQILLDVRRKLAEDETLVIHAFSMDIDIRGTSLYARVIEKAMSMPDPAHLKREIHLGVMEGSTQATFPKETGENAVQDIPMGNELRLLTEGRVTLLAEMGVFQMQTAPQFVQDQVNKNDELKEHISEGGGDFIPTTWDEPVTLVAQSASKVYDGKALTATKVMVYGLPAGYTCSAMTTGSRTDAGESDNKVADDYKIYDSANNDVTNLFTNIETVSGKLIVLPATLTVWTGSSSKVYDGTPLTNKEAVIKVGKADVQGKTYEELSAMNYAVVVSNSEFQVLYGICGKVLVQCIDPSTGEISQAELTAGKKMTIGLDTLGVIDYHTENVLLQNLPEAVLRTYQIHEEMITPACEQAKWDTETLRGLVGSLKSSVVPEIIQDCVNIETYLNNEITEYFSSTLGSEEITFVQVTLDPNITVTTTGSQTAIGQSENKFTIAWGTARSKNYTVIEFPGILKVTAAEQTEEEDPNKDTKIEVTLTAASATKVYDGNALTNSDVTAEGLPNGYTFTATTSGTQTDVGSSMNVISSCKIFDAGGTDVTSSISKITKVSGTLTVEALKIETSWTGSFDYNGYQQDPTNGIAVMKYLNGPQTGDTLSASVDSQNNFVFSLFTGDQITVTATGGGKDAGTYKVSLTAQVPSEKEGDFQVSTKDGEMKIQPIELVIMTGSSSKPYDGNELTCQEVAVSGLAEADKKIVKVTTSGTIKNKGKTENTYTVDWGTVNKENYTIKAVLGTLEVFESTDAIVFELQPASKTYDGKPLKSAEVKVTGLPEGYTYSFTTTGSQTDAGASTISISSYTIFDPESTEVTSFFKNISTRNSTLTVNKAPLTVTTGSASKVYDGTPLTAAASITGLVNGETATLTSASLINAGSVTNSYSIEWGTTKAENYTITEQLGTLKIEPLKMSAVWALEGQLVYCGIPYTAEAGGMTLTYLNGPHKDETLTLYEGQAIDGNDLAGLYTFELYTGEKVNVTVTGGGKDAGTYTLTATPTLSGSQASNYQITCNEPSLVIAPIELIVETGSAERAYDESITTPLTNSEVKVYQVVAGQDDPVLISKTDEQGIYIEIEQNNPIYFTATGSNSEVGKKDNTYSITWGNENQNNCHITDKLGILDIYIDTIVIKAKTGSFNWDGIPEGYIYYSVDGLPAGYTIDVETERTLYKDNGVYKSWTNEVVSYQIFDTGGNDVTENCKKIVLRTGLLSVVDSPVVLESNTVTIYAGEDSDKVFFGLWGQEFRIANTTNVYQVLDKCNDYLGLYDSDEDFENAVFNVLHSLNWI